MLCKVTFRQLKILRVCKPYICFHLEIKSYLPTLSLNTNMPQVILITRIYNWDASTAFPKNTKWKATWEIPRENFCSDYGDNFSSKDKLFTMIHFWVVVIFIILNKRIYFLESHKIGTFVFILLTFFCCVEIYKKKIKKNKYF